MKRILENFALHINLSTEEINISLAFLQSINVKKNTVLTFKGSVCRNIYFVDRGCLRLFSTDKDGVEHNVLFCPENWWITDMESFSKQSAAFYSIGSLEDSQVYYYALEDLEKLYVQVPKFERFFRILMQNGFGLYQNRITSGLSKTAQQRYAAFKKLYPDLERRISQKHIASYLGITPTFLSRIRKHSSDKS